MLQNIDLSHSWRITYYWIVSRPSLRSWYKLSWWEGVRGSGGRAVVGISSSAASPVSHKDCRLWEIPRGPFSHASRRGRLLSFVSSLPRLQFRKLGDGLYLVQGGNDAEFKSGRRLLIWITREPTGKPPRLQKDKESISYPPEAVPKLWGVFPMK